MLYRPQRSRKKRGQARFVTYNTRRDRGRVARPVKTLQFGFRRVRGKLLNQGGLHSAP